MKRRPSPLKFWYVQSGSTVLPSKKLAWKPEAPENQVAKETLSHTMDYVRQTSLHGLKYLADKEANILEKILWITTFLLGFCASMVMIFVMWTKWELSPILISIENTDVPISELVFPAISICNVNKISEQRLRTLRTTSRRFANVTEDELILLLGTLLKYNSNAVNDARILQVQEKIKLKNLTTGDLVRFMRMAAQPCSSMVRYCTWQGKVIVDCSALFKATASSEGFCCAFNSAAQENRLPVNFTLNRGEETNSSFNLRDYTLGEGVDMGLTVLLDANIQDYALPTSSFYGFKVLIHHPEDMPNAAGQGFAIGPGNEVFAGIRTHSVLSTSDVERLHFKKRNCYFRKERALQYFSSYSKSNCVLEHKADYVLKACGCLPFYYPAVGKAFNVCTMDKNDCLYETQAEFHRTNYNNCLPDCNTMAFTVDVSEGPFPNALHLDPRYGFEEKLLEDIPYNSTQDIKDNVALLHVFFRDRTGIQYRRDVRYGWHDFVSSVGGLLGLGLGFSFLSFVEIVYFFGLRWCMRTLGRCC